MKKILAAVTRPTPATVQNGITSSGKPVARPTATSVKPPKGS